MIRLIVINLKLQYRNRQRLFWTLVFPLLFTVIFGFFFGQGNGTTASVALINQSSSTLAMELTKNMKSSDYFKVTEGITESESRDLIKKSQIGALINIPSKFGEATADAPTKIKVIYDPANTQSTALTLNYLNQFLTRASFQAVNQQPIFGLEEEKTNTRKLSYFDFVLVGLIGMALMNSSIQGLAIALSQYREDKILKRITTTPLPSYVFIGAEIISRLILNLVQVGLILGVGVYAFGGHIYGSIPLLVAVSMIGALLFQLIGFVVAAYAKTTQGAEGMATAIAIPMMFLAGVFFPIDQLPKWLYSIVQYLPLAPFLRMTRAIALEQASPLNDPKNIIIVLVWILGLSLLAIWRFRLSEE